MPIITDNNFARDTYGMRAERLNAIQTNLSIIQPELEAPAAIVTWAADCYDVFTDLRSTAGVESNEKEGATLDAEMKLELMEDEYQNAKALGQTAYADDPVHLKDFDFHKAYPDSRNDQIDRVDKVLKVHERHAAEGITHLIPAMMITRLTTAMENASAALGVQDTERAESEHATAALSKRFETDSETLRSLKAWWFAMMGKSDARIDYIGMVNPKDHHGGATPAAPAGLAFDAATNTFSWDASETATSYQLAYRAAGTDDDWEAAYSGVDTSTVFDPGEGVWEFKVRARNSHGYGDFSTPIDVDTRPVPAPENLRSVADGSNPNQYDLLWNDVATADSYDLYISRVALGGDPAGFWVDVADATSPTTIEVNASRTEYYKVKAKRGGVESDFSNMIRLDWTE